LRLKGKVALITGSSRGIGKAIASAFAKEGANLVVNYISSEERAKNVVSELKRLGANAIAVRADVSKNSEVEDMIKKCMEEYDTLDILVNNAGIGKWGAVKDFSETDWNEVMATNLRGAFLCSKAVVPIMQRQGAGCIINIASLGAFSCYEESSAYSASKAGVVALTKALANEVGPQIRVNAIAPGFIQTDLQADSDEESKAWIMKTTPLKRLGQPEDVAQVAVFLAAEADFITGQTIIVDGGRGR
jgi:3-oxoacyl-[acyl-carrier protein] reductase